MDETLHIYLRVSSTTQATDGFGIQNQKESGESVASQLGFKVKVWNEGDASSSKDNLDNRPVLQDLLIDIEDGEVQHLYVYNTDRLSRNQQTWGAIRHKLSVANVKLYTGNNPSPMDLTDLTQDLLLGVLSEIASYDNRLRTKRLSLGKIKKIKEGGWQGGPPPFGYQIVDGYLRPQPYEKRWVNKIYEAYADGASTKSIQDMLLVNGVRTRRGNSRWSLGSIRQLLINPHYGGTYTFSDKASGEIIQCHCDAIVSQKIIKKVRKAFQERSYAAKGRIKEGQQKHNYLSKEFLVCGHCGNKMGARRNKIQYYDHYYCRTKEKEWKGRDTMPCKDRVRSIIIPQTDDIVWKSFVEVVSTSHLFKETIKNDVMEKHQTHHNSEEDKKRIKREMNKLRKELEQVIQVSSSTEAMGLLKRKSSDEVKQILDVLGEEKSKILERMEELQNVLNDRVDHSQWVDWVKMFGDKIEEWKSEDFTFEDKQILLREFINKIEVVSSDKTTHKLKIHFKMPYVEDGFEWKFKKVKDEWKKDGYELKGGKKIFQTDFIPTSKKKIKSL